jgi:hypothetical protein
MATTLPSALVEEFGDVVAHLGEGVAAEFLVEPLALVPMASSAMSDSTPSWRHLWPIAAAGDVEGQFVARADDADH